MAEALRHSTLTCFNAPWRKKQTNRQKTPTHKQTKIPQTNQKTQKTLSTIKWAKSMQWVWWLTKRLCYFLQSLQMLHMLSWAAAWLQSRQRGLQVVNLIVLLTGSPSGQTSRALLCTTSWKALTESNGSNFQAPTATMADNKNCSESKTWRKRLRKLEFSYSSSLLYPSISYQSACRLINT